MPIKTKDALKGVFKKDNIPTEDNFADLIDTFICSINGNKPDISGDMNILFDNIEGFYRIKDFGAKGDGITDDATIINFAINKLSNEGGGTLRFDANIYLIGSTINMKNNVTLLGVNNKTTILTKTNTFDAIAFNVDNYNTEINGCIIKATGGINESVMNSAIYYGRFKNINSRIQNVKIDSFYNGIETRNYWKSSFLNTLQFIGCRTSIKVEQERSQDVSSVTFINVFSENPKNNHLNLKHVEGFTFIGCRFQGDGTKAYSMNLEGCCMNFQNCRFDGMDSIENDYAIFSISDNSLIGFDNCYFMDQKSTGINVSLFELKSNSKMSLNDCAFEISTGFTYMFKVDSNSKIKHSNLSRIDGMPGNNVSQGGTIIDVDYILANKDVIESNNGTKFKLIVDNDGTLISQRI